MYTVRAGFKSNEVATGGSLREVLGPNGMALMGLRRGTFRGILTRTGILWLLLLLLLLAKNGSPPQTLPR